MGVPPIEKTTDADVVDYVKKNPEAIGYVSKDAELLGVLTVEIE